MIAQLPGFEQLSAAPICGEDFCDSCGDCLHCYDLDSCPNGGHVWVVYTEQVDEWRSKHPDADVAERLRTFVAREHGEGS